MTGMWKQGRVKGRDEGVLREKDRERNGEETKEIRGGASPKHDGLQALMVTWETCRVSHCLGNAMGLRSCRGPRTP